MLRFRRLAIVGATCLAATTAGAQAAAPTKTHATVDVQRLSWAGVKIAYGATTLFIDAFASPDIWDGKWTDPIAPLEADTDARYALVTHLHNDHFDPPAIRKAIGEKGAVICTPWMAAAVAQAGFRVFVVNPWEPFLVREDFTVIPVPAQDYDQAEQVSWVVIGGGKRFIHSGDTMWHNKWHRIGRAYGPFDVAFLPINGADLLQRKPQSHVPATLTPEQAAAAAEMLHARKVVPIHYGMNDPAYYIEFPNAVAAFTAAAGKRGLAVDWRKPGEWVTWDAGRP